MSGRFLEPKLLGAPMLTGDLVMSARGRRQAAQRYLPEVNARGYLDGDNRGGCPLDCEAERGPPARVGDELTAMLPKVLEPVPGVKLHGRAVQAAGTKVSFSDGSSLDVRSVIWATGFGVDHS